MGCLPGLMYSKKPTMTIRLVCGPPAAGKSTYVKEQAQPNDLVIDLDALRDTYKHDDIAQAVRQSLEASAGVHPGDVWVIRTLADAQQRTDAAKRIGATETVVLATPAELAKSRAVKRDPDKDLSEPIDRWWKDYTMVESDLIVSPDMEHPSDKEKQMAMRKPTQIRNLEGDGTGGGSDKDPGFPKDTPLAEMTTYQQVAYWKHHARKHEGIANARGDYDQVKADAEKWKTYQDSNKAPDQKVLDAAIETARSEERAKNAPRLVKAEFKAAAAGNIPPELLDAFLEDVNHTTYVKPDGELDTDKIAKRVEALTPKQEQRQQRQTHQGYRPNDGATSVANGRDLWASRQKQKG